MTAECPSGYEVLFSKEWPGLAESCNCLTEAMVAERNLDQSTPRVSKPWKIYRDFKAIKFKDDSEFYSKNIKAGQKC